MDNQHRKIKGYRELNEEEIAAMNEVKELGVQCGDVPENLRKAGADPRWLAIAKTDLQKGLMAATRSVAKPDFF